MSWIIKLKWLRIERLVGWYFINGMGRFFFLKVLINFLMIFQPIFRIKWLIK
jgi:hypothetical protein